MTFVKQTIHNQAIYSYEVFIKSVDPDDAILNKYKAVISDTITSDNMILTIEAISPSNEYHTCSLYYNDHVNDGFWNYLPNDSIELTLPLGID